MRIGASRTASCRPPRVALAWPMTDQRLSSAVAGPRRDRTRCSHGCMTCSRRWTATGRRWSSGRRTSAQAAIRTSRCSTSSALHPASVEYHQRYAESLDHLYNRLRLSGGGTDFMRALDAALERASRAMELLRRLGYAGERRPDVLEQLFFEPRAIRSTGRSSTTRRCRRRAAPRQHRRRPRTTSSGCVDAASTLARCPAPARRLHRQHAAEGAALPAAAPRAAARLLGRQPAARRGARRDDSRGGDGAHATNAVRPRATEPRGEREPLRARSTRTTRGSPATDRPRRRSSSPARDRRRTRRVAARARSLAARALERPADRAARARCSPSTSTAARYRLDAWLLGLVHYALALMRRSQRRGQSAHGVSTSAPTAGSRTCGPKARDADARACCRRDLAELVSSPRRSRRSCATRPTAATSTRRRSTTPSPPRCCATAISPTRRRRSPDALAVNLSSRARAHARSACSRACATARASARCSATSSSAACTTATALAEVDQLHLRAAQGVPAARRPARRPRGPTRTCRSRRSRRATWSTACALVEHVKATGHDSLSVRVSTLPAADAERARRDRRRGRRGCSTSTTRSPTSRSPRASTRRCRATTTASPRRSTPTRSGQLPARARRRPHAAQRRRRSRTAWRCTSSRRASRRLADRRRWR